MEKNGYIRPTNVEYMPDRLMKKKFDVEDAGYYYVHIYNTNPNFDKKIDYRIIIGEPLYSVGSYTVKYNGYDYINAQSPIAQESFDLSNEENIPEGAIVYKVCIGGQQENRAYGQTRSLRPNNTYKWITTREFIFEKENVYNKSQPIELKQKWDLKIEADTLYDKYYGIKPSVRFNYIYE